MEQRSAVQDNSFAACSHGGNDRAGSAPDATGLTVRELQPAQLSIWDRFVEQSPQGTIFSESLWLEICGLPFRGFACYKGDVIVGGVAVFEDESSKSTMGTVPLTPFQGFLFRDNGFMKPPLREKLEKKVSHALIDALECR